MPLSSWLGFNGGEEKEEMAGETGEKEESPQYVTKAEYDQTLTVLQSLQTGIQTLTSGFNAVVADRQARKEEPQIEDVTDEEIEEALRSGEGAGKFRKMVNASVEKLRRDVLGPELAAGFGALEGLTREVSATKMPYYDKYKKEIDEYVGALTPQQRLRPEAYKTAHDYVVGLHVTEILAEQAEASKRQKNEPPQGGLPGGAPGRQARGGETRETSFQFSEENHNALAVKGYTPDMQAQRMGYKSWQDYMDKTSNIEI